MAHFPMNGPGLGMRNPIKPPTQDYNRLTEVFNWYVEEGYINEGDFDWEAVNTTTDDGHILTSFRVWATNGAVEAKPSVLFMHGDFMDGVEWFNIYDDNGRLPLHLQLA